MQKVHTINLGGIVFQIEEDAYGLLRQYIESIREYFKNTQGGVEISNDIEYRLGEMFYEKLQNGKNLIIKSDVEQVIGVMGQPKDFGYEENPLDTSKTEYKTKRKFFRDPDNKIIGGICSGIGAFFGIEQIWIIRLFFLGSLFFFSFGFWVYIILWIVVPKAKTTADKLSMKGESATIENIAKNFEEGIKNLDSGTFNSFVKKIANFIEYIILAFISFFSRVAGAILLFITGILFIVLFALSNLKSEHVNIGTAGFSLSDFMHFVIPVSMEPMHIYICMFILLGIPLFYLFLLSLRLLGTKFTISKYVHIAAVICFVVTAFWGFYLTIKVAEEFAMESSTSQVLKMDIKEEVLNIVPYESMGNTGQNVIRYGGNDVDFMVTDSGIFIRDIKLIIEKSSSQDVELVYTTSARGTNKKQAQVNERSVIYKFSKADENLYLDTYFRIPVGNNWRYQQVELKLRLPEGKRLRLDPVINQFDLEINDEDFDYDTDYLEGKTVEMTDEGLKCLDCYVQRKIKKNKHRHDIEEPELPEVPEEPEEPESPEEP